MSKKIYMIYRDWHTRRDVVGEIAVTSEGPALLKFERSVASGHICQVKRSAEGRAWFSSKSAAEAHLVAKLEERVQWLKGELYSTEKVLKEWQVAAHP